MDLRINRESIDETETEKTEEFSPLTGYIYAINSIIGAGFLSIPWAYENSGWLFSLIFQILVSMHSFYLILQLFEAMSRAEVLFRMTESGKDIHPIVLTKMFQNFKHEDLMLSPHLTPAITSRIINISDMVKLAFNEKTGMVYMFCLFLFQMGILVAYSAIFASSFASNVPLGSLGTCDIYETSSFLNSCRVKYWVFLTIFSCITLYMTVGGIQEQKIVQQIMSVLRFVVMFAIIFTCAACIATNTNLENDDYNDAKFPEAIDGRSIGHAIPILLFASCYHTQVPCISQSVKSKEKYLKKIHFFTVLTCFSFYTCLGLITSTAIKDVPSMVSMSYRSYSAGHSEDDRPIWTYMIEYIIVISPALDVMSTFPVVALTISGSILTWKYGGNFDLVDKKIIFGTRFIIGFIPLFISFFVYNLGSILDWVGLISFLVVHIPIPLLHTALRHMVAGKSSYDVWGSCWTNLILSVSAMLLMVLVLVEI